jgi:hypothetical protein
MPMRDGIPDFVGAEGAADASGARVGKGGGYSDLEFALVRKHGRLHERTP